MTLPWWSVGLTQEDGWGRLAVGDGFNVHGYSIISIIIIIIDHNKIIAKSIHGYKLRTKNRDNPFHINDLNGKIDQAGWKFSLKSHRDGSGSVLTLFR